MNDDREKFDLNDIYPFDAAYFRYQVDSFHNFNPPSKDAGGGIGYLVSMGIGAVVMLYFILTTK